MRLAVALGAAFALASCATVAIDEDKVLYEASRMTLPVGKLPEPAIVIAQYPTRANLAYAVLIVLHETPQGVASSLTIEPENDRFHLQLQRRSWKPRVLRMNQWNFSPSDCPAMAELYKEFATVPELEPPEFLPPHATPRFHVVDMYVTKDDSILSLGAPDKYTSWAARVWKELDTCRAGRKPRRL